MPRYFLHGEWTELPEGEEVPAEVKLEVLEICCDRGERVWVDWVDDKGKKGSLCVVEEVSEELGVVSLRDVHGQLISVEISNVSAVRPAYL